MADTVARLALASTRKKMLCAVGLGVLSGLGQAPWGFWWLTLAALAVLAILFDTSRDWRQGAWIGWAAGVGYFGLVLSWIVEPFLVDVARHGWMAPFALIGIAGGMALFWALGFGLARALGGARHAPLMLVATLTATELLRAYLLTGFPWGMLAYIWAGLPPMQLAAWVGPHGLTLLTLLLTFGTYAVTVLPRVKAVLMGGLIWAGIVGASIFAMPPTVDIPADRPTVRLLQPNAAQHLKWREDMIPVFFQRQLDFSGFEGSPDLVVWPETSVPALLENADQTLRTISEAANGAMVAIGIQRSGAAGFYNSLAVLGDGGEASRVYDKHHLVPFGEYVPGGAVAERLGIRGFAAQSGFGYTPGPGPALLDFGALGKALPLICYEAIFPQDVNGAPSRPDWLLQITNDAWFGTYSGPYQHLAQARFRAVEQGLPLLRAANTGITAVVDPFGRVLDHIPLGEAGYLDAKLPLAATPTLYSRTGDVALFALLALVLCGAMVAARRNSN